MLDGDQVDDRDDGREHHSDGDGSQCLTLVRCHAGNLVWGELLGKELLQRGHGRASARKYALQQAKQNDDEWGGRVSGVTSGGQGKCS